MSTSTVSNIVRDVTGAVVPNVLVTAQLLPGSAFRTSDFTEVASLASVTSAADGSWSMVLERNSDIVPEFTYYVITENIPASRGGAKSYTIQVGVPDANLLASLVTPIQDPQPEFSNFLTQAAADARYQALGGLSSATPSSIDPDDAGAAGVSTSASRADHQHGIVAAAASGLTLVTTNTEGVATSFARSDHTHAITWNPPACGVSRDTDQTISNNTVTAVQFTAEQYDASSMHDNAVNNTRVTVPIAGLYAISFFAQFSTSGSAMVLQLGKNGTSETTLARIDSTGTLKLSGSTVLKLVANDYLEGLVFQLTGGDVTLSQATMTVVWVGTGN